MPQDDALREASARRPRAIGLWLALTLAGIIAAFVATNAIWAVISWAVGGVAAFVLAAVRARRGG